MAAAPKKTNVPEDRLRLYQRLLESVPGVAEKSNFGSAYTAVNGTMYSMISKHGVVGIRLPEPDRSAFLAKYAPISSVVIRPGLRRRTSLECPVTCSSGPMSSRPTSSAASRTC